MKFRLLSKTEQELFDADAVAIVDYTDVAAMGASTTGNVAVMPGTTTSSSGIGASGSSQPAVGTSGTDSIPAGFNIGLKFVIVDTAFVSGSATGLALTVGDSGSNNRFLTTSQLQSGQTPITYALGTLGQYATTATEVVNAYLTSTAANLSTFTAGSMRLFFRIEDLTALPKV